MEYIQTVLAQIEASRLEQASESGGLLSELDEHREFLKEQPGFRDLRLTRSINNEGNILLVAETRWADDESLVRYETNEPNIASIVNKHYDVVLGDSVQVLDMEALRTEASWKPMEAAAQARARLTLPLIVPLGVLAFTLLVVYGLSRVYLALDKDTATGLAAGIAVGILLFAAYLASHPRVPGWQIGAIFVIAGAVLGGGAIYSVSTGGEGEAKETTVSASPGSSPGASPGPGGGATVTQGDNFFEFNGQKNPTIPVKAGQTVTFQIVNNGSGTHNMHVGDLNNQFTGSAVCQPGGDVICSDPDIIAAGQKATISFTIAKAGTYDFRCDFHPQQMIGKIQVQ